MSDTWKLILGDCLDPVTGMASLADKSVDHVITDPPYEDSAHTKQRRVKRGNGSGSMDMRSPLSEPLPFPPISDDDRMASARKMFGLARRWSLIFCQVEAAMKWASHAGDIAEYVRTMVWIKPDGMPQYTGDRPGMGYESIVACHAPGKKRWNGGGKHGVYRHMKQQPDDSSGRTDIHPTRKPDALMEAIVRDFTDPGDLILDPFAGSGTTGVAAIRLGRRFVGWERDPKYHAIAVKRLSAAREQLDMFGAAR